MVVDGCGIVRGHRIGGRFFLSPDPLAHNTPHVRHSTPRRNYPVDLLQPGSHRLVIAGHNARPIEKSGRF